MQLLLHWPRKNIGVDVKDTETPCLGSEKTIHFAWKNSEKKALQSHSSRKACGVTFRVALRTQLLLSGRSRKA